MFSLKALGVALAVLTVHHQQQIEVLDAVGKGDGDAALPDHQFQAELLDGLESAINQKGIHPVGAEIAIYPQCSGQSVRVGIVVTLNADPPVTQQTAEKMPAGVRACCLVFGTYCLFCRGNPCYLVLLWVFSALPYYE